MLAIVASMKCPHCGVLAHFSIMHQHPVIPTTRKFSNIGAVGYMTCTNCVMPVALAADASGAVFGRWPLVQSGRAYPDAPEGIAAAAAEAHRCLEANAPRAAAVMARSVIEAVAKEKGVGGRNRSIMAMIDSLESDGHISEAMKEAAHEIRFAGNAAVHFSPVEDSTSQEDAEEILDLMAAILMRVYEEPAQVQRVRARREAREQGTPLPREPRDGQAGGGLYLSTYDSDDMPF